MWNRDSGKYFGNPRGPKRRKNIKCIASDVDTYDESLSLPNYQKVTRSRAASQEARFWLGSNATMVVGSGRRHERFYPHEPQTHVSTASEPEIQMRPIYRVRGF